MAVKSCRLVRCAVTILFPVIVFLLSPATAGAILHSLDGGGNFHTSVDVINRWVTEDRLDVLVLVETSNANLKFEEVEDGLMAKLRIEVELLGPDGTTVFRKRPVRTAVLSPAEAASPTLFQVFGVVLEDVPYRAGRIQVGVYDVNRKRPGILNSAKKNDARSECATDWAAEDGPRAPRGIALEDPLFVAHAPFTEWNPDRADDPAGEETGWLQDYVHPSRRYGLEQDRLQLFQPVWPQPGGVTDEADLAGLQVQIVSLDMEYVITDTVTFDRRGRAALSGGRPAGLFYELDVNLLPEGSYRMGIAPLGGQGRASVKEFNVVWRLEALARHHAQLLGEGRTVFTGRELQDFLAASTAEQERMLDDFWESRNPDPESPVNEAYLEFQYRLAYVKRFFGGFGEHGAEDDRGEVFLLLGPPDEMQLHHMPMNFRDQDDARIKVFERFAPDREGTIAKGSSEGGTQSNISPYQEEGGIPMPYSRRSEAQRRTVVGSATHHYPFELWKYDDGGKPLFTNRFSEKGWGQRFLFIDRTGSGDYALESSNVLQGEE
jgi:GWxTD domain-containing protein